MQATGNAVELMAGKIEGFDPETQEILKIGACIGNRFSIDVIAIIFGKPLETIMIHLSDTLIEGLIYISGNSYCFFHDRIQEAAYYLIPESRREELHYRIGKYMLGNTNEEELLEKILYIIDHINSGISLVLKEEEKYRFAELELIAGKKAKSSTAYESALNYIKLGIELIGEEE